MKELKELKDIRLDFTPDNVAREAARQIIAAAVDKGMPAGQRAYRDAWAQLWTLCKGCGCDGARQFYRAVVSNPAWAAARALCL